MEKTFTRQTVIPYPTTSTIHEPNQFATPDELPTLMKPQVDANTPLSMQHLMQQNEDLLARLNVSIKRCFQNEQDIESRDQSLVQLRKDNKNLQDQILILREKDRVLMERHRKIQGEYDQYQQKIDFLTTKYKEFRENADLRLNTFSETLGAQKRELTRLRKYRSKIQKIAAHQQAQLKRQEGELNQLREQKARMHVRLSENLAFIGTQKSQFESERAELIRLHEQQLDLNKGLIERLNTEISQLQSRLKNFDELKGQNVQLRNQIISMERDSEMRSQNHQKELSDLQEKLGETRQRDKSSTLEALKLKSRNAELSEDIARLKDDFDRSENQVQSLQLLWKDNQKTIEQQEERIRSLQRLNQQLCEQLESQRKDHDDQAKSLATQKLQQKAQVHAAMEQARMTTFKLPDEKRSQINQLIERLEKLTSSL